jgi:hypothetical protein
MSQTPEIHGPPAHYTPNWPVAWASVRILDAIEPNRVITGHGVPFTGQALRSGLHALAERFDEPAIPPQGRYVGHRAKAYAGGVVSVPPDGSNPWPRVFVGLGPARSSGLPSRQ